MDVIVGVDIGKYTLKSCLYTFKSKAITNIDNNNTSTLLLFQVTSNNGKINLKYTTKTNTSVKYPKKYLGINPNESLKNVQFHPNYEGIEGLYSPEITVKIKKEEYTIKVFDIYEWIFEDICKKILTTGYTNDLKKVCFMISQPHNANEIYTKQMNYIANKLKEKVGNVKIVDEIVGLGSYHLDSQSEKSERVMTIDLSYEKCQMSIVDVDKNDSVHVEKYFKFLNNVSGNVIDEKIKNDILEDNSDLADFIDENKSAEIQLMNVINKTKRNDDGNYSINLDELEFDDVEDLDPIEFNEEELFDLLSNEITEITETIEQMKSECEKDDNKPITKIFIVESCYYHDIINSIIKDIFDDQITKAARLSTHVNSIAEGVINTFFQSNKISFDSIPFSIGIDLFQTNDKMKFLFNKGEMIPEKQKMLTKSFPLNLSNNTFHCSIYQGEFEECQRNKLIVSKEIIINDILQPPNSIKLFASFTQSGKLKIECGKKRQPKTTILETSLVDDGSEMKPEEKDEREKRLKAQKRNDLTLLYNQMKYFIERNDLKMLIHCDFDFHLIIDKIENDEINEVIIKRLKIMYDYFNSCENEKEREIILKRYDELFKKYLF